MKPVLKDHSVRELINSLRDTALQYHSHHNLRERIAEDVIDFLKDHCGYIQPCNRGKKPNAQ